MCNQHGCEIRQFLDTKLQCVFSQVRNEYDKQCGCLLTTIEHDINQMNAVLQDLHTSFDSSPWATNEALANLHKQSQRIDVATKNLRYEWQLLTQTGRASTSAARHVTRTSFFCFAVDKFEREASALPSPVCMPKTDAVIKLELGMRDQQQPIPRLTAEDNKENLFDGNPLCAHSQAATASVAPCRPKNDVSCFLSILLVHARCYFVDAILLIDSLHFLDCSSSSTLRIVHVK